MSAELTELVIQNQAQSKEDMREIRDSIKSIASSVEKLTDLSIKSEMRHAEHEKDKQRLEDNQRELGKELKDYRINSQSDIQEIKEKMIRNSLVVNALIAVSGSTAITVIGAVVKYMFFK